MDHLVATERYVIHRDVGTDLKHGAMQLLATTARAVDKLSRLISVKVSLNLNDHFITSNDNKTAYTLLVR